MASSAKCVCASEGVRHQEAAGGVASGAPQQHFLPEEWSAF